MIHETRKAFIISANRHIQFTIIIKTMHKSSRLNHSRRVDGCHGFDARHRNNVDRVVIRGTHSFQQSHLIGHARVSSISWRLNRVGENLK